MATFRASSYGSEVEGACTCRGYPAARDREVDYGERVDDRYDRQQSTAGEVVTTDPVADLITFAGFVDAVHVSARANGALFTFTDRLNRELATVGILAGNDETIPVRCERVRVQALVAGAQASVTATGLYGLRAEIVEGVV